MKRDIELFHILFCKSLLTTQDKSLIVLKGGCNLRFFLGSNRYSEDIDFEIETIARDTLRKRVDKVLGSKTFLAMLLARKIEVETSTAPKQTDTVQRWKVTLKIRGLLVPTKIEFSHRGIKRDGVQFDPIDALLLNEHALSPIFMSHYTAEQATLQKIKALTGRKETQARDVYDLDLLFSRNAGVVQRVSETIIEKAIECVVGIDFDQFRGQVVEFLSSDAQDFFSSSKTWDGLQLRVIKKLEGCRDSK